MTKKILYAKAFMLVETLVMISIMAVLGIVGFSSFKNYRDAVGVTSAAHTVALALREAQVGATAAQEFRIGSHNFNGIYGIYFNMAYPSKYIFFGDTAAVGSGVIYNHIYDESDSVPDCSTFTEECIRRTDMGPDAVIQRICFFVPPLPTDCTATIANIAFERPNLQALINKLVGGMPVQQTNVEIDLASPEGVVRTVVVTYAGQIYVR